VTRRRLLKTSAGAAGLVAFGAGNSWAGRPARAGTLLQSRAPLPVPFQLPLPIPQVLTAKQHPDYPGADYYEIEQRVADQRILPGLSTRIWGFNGTFPGPTIVSRSGRRTVIRHTNRLPVPTVTHLHGGHVPAASSGFPTDLLLPDGYRATAAGMADMAGMPTMAGSADPAMPPDPHASIATGSRTYDYPMSQRAATLWYHDHRMGFTGPSVWRGLAGMHIVQDEEERALPLPKGERDIPLIITDRSFGADGAFLYPAIDPTGTMTPGVTDSFMNGVLGDVVLVNGAPWPVLEVQACRYRFRILNASNARRYLLALDPAPAGELPLVQIGSDGGLLARPYRQASITVAPAERFDVVIDFSRYRAGQEITLLNGIGLGSTAHVMRFRVTGPADDPSSIPDRLSTLERLDPAKAVATRDFLFQNRQTGWAINGRTFDPARPLTQSRLGDIEVWRFMTDLHHSVHVHLGHFQVLSRQGNAPGPSDAGWKDTVDMIPAEEVSVAIRFTDYAGRYVMHCHNLEHEDMAMMAAISVV
jgi:spore coat protein A